MRCSRPFDFLDQLEILPVEVGLKLVVSMFLHCFKQQPHKSKTVFSQPISQISDSMFCQGSQGHSAGRRARLEEALEASGSPEACQTFNVQVYWSAGQNVFGSQASKVPNYGECP